MSLTFEEIKNMYHSSHPLEEQHPYELVERIQHENEELLLVKYKYNGKMKYISKTGFLSDTTDSSGNKIFRNMDAKTFEICHSRVVKKYFSLFACGPTLLQSGMTKGNAERNQLLGTLSDPENECETDIYFVWGSCSNGVYVKFSIG